MRLYTSYFANQRNFPKDLVPVAVSAMIPKGWRGLWLRELAPTPLLLSKYKWQKEMAFDLYCKEYETLVLSVLDAEQVVRRLARLTRDRDVALLCYEKEYSECHRSVLAAWLTSHGHPTVEWRKSND